MLNKKNIPPSHECKKLNTSWMATEGNTIDCLVNALSKPRTQRLTCNQVSAHRLAPDPPSSACAIRDNPNS